MSTEPAAEPTIGSLLPPVGGRSAPEGQQTAGDDASEIDRKNFTAFGEYRPVLTRHRPLLVRRLDRTAFVAVLGALGIEVFAITLGVNEHFFLATVFAWVATALSAAAVIAALPGLARHRRRRLAIITIAVGVAGNPLFLVWLFTLLGH